MIRWVFAVLGAGFLFTTAEPARAEGMQRLGFGMLVNNDFLGDFQDRGQSGGVQTSRLYGFGWDGYAPAGFGQLLELRIAGDIKAPDNLRRPDAGDRPYAGTLSFGLHSHVARGATDFSLGGDLVLTGPMTKLGEFHTAIHDVLHVSPPSKDVLDDQIENGVHPTLVAELGHTFNLSANTTVRPYVEGRAGDETLMRAGWDMTIGGFGRGDLLVRDKITGQRYRAIGEQGGGTSFVLGADIAKVDDSIYLPEDRGYELSDTRQRLRAGVHVEGTRGSAFYGLTWLGEEYEGQPGNGQVVGSLRLDLKF